MLSKITQNNEIHFYNRNMSQAKEDVVVTSHILSINCLHKSRVQIHNRSKKEFMSENRIAQPYYRHCSTTKSNQKNKNKPAVLSRGGVLENVHGLEDTF